MRGRASSLVILFTSVLSLSCAKSNSENGAADVAPCSEAYISDYNGLKVAIHGLATSPNSLTLPGLDTVVSQCDQFKSAYGERACSAALASTGAGIQTSYADVAKPCEILNTRSAQLKASAESEPSTASAGVVLPPLPPAF